MELREAQEKIIVALDCGPYEAIRLAKELEGTARWLKVGMTLYYEAGPRIVSELKEMGFHIFLDLKLLDIPHQVEGAARASVTSGADILSVHSLGGPSMLKAAIKGAREANEKARVIAITVLTSLGDKDLPVIGISTPAQDEVNRLAKLAKDAGCKGVVCSGKEVENVREALGKDALIVCPGIRLATTETQDQVRIVTPSKAIKKGASCLVIGRPITQANNPNQAFLKAACDIVENT